MVKLINPTNEKLTIKFQGVEYSIEANSELKDIPEFVAIHWKDTIHGFLLIEEQKEVTPTPAPAEVVETPVETVVETVEVVEVEKPVEAVKTETKPSKKSNKSK